MSAASVHLGFIQYLYGTRWFIANNPQINPEQLKAAGLEHCFLCALDKEREYVHVHEYSLTEACISAGTVIHKVVWFHLRQLKINTTYFSILIRWCSICNVQTKQ